MKRDGRKAGDELQGRLYEEGGAEELESVLGDTDELGVQRSEKDFGPAPATSR